MSAWQRDLADAGAAEYRAAMQTRKSVGGGISAGQLKKLFDKAGALVRSRERAGECTDLDRTDLRKCLGRSERCFTTKEASKERRLTTYIKAAEARGRLVRIGHGRWQLLWHADPPPKVDPQYKERVPVKRRVCAATAEIRARRLSRGVAKPRTKSNRGGHAAHKSQPREGGAFAPRARNGIAKVRDVAAARDYLARLAAQEAARATQAKVEPHQPARDAQHSAPRGVVVELWPLTHGPPTRSRQR